MDPNQPPFGNTPPQGWGPTLNDQGQLQSYSQQALVPAGQFPTLARPLSQHELLHILRQRQELDRVLLANQQLQQQQQLLAMNQLPNTLPVQHSIPMQNLPFPAQQLPMQTVQQPMSTAFSMLLPNAQARIEEVPPSLQPTPFQNQATPHVNPFTRGHMRAPSNSTQTPEAGPSQPASQANRPVPPTSQQPPFVNYFRTPHGQSDQRNASSDEAAQRAAVARLQSNTNFQPPTKSQTIVGPTPTGYMQNRPPNPSSGPLNGLLPKESTPTQQAGPTMSHRDAMAKVIGDRRSAGSSGTSSASPSPVITDDSGAVPVRVQHRLAGSRLSGTPQPIISAPIQPPSASTVPSASTITGPAYFRPNTDSPAQTVNPSDLTLKAQTIWARADPAPPPLQPQPPVPVQPPNASRPSDVQAIAQSLLYWVSGRLKGAYEVKALREHLDQVITFINLHDPTQVPVLWKRLKGRMRLDKEENGQTTWSILVGDNPPADILALYATPPDKPAPKPDPSTVPGPSSSNSSVQRSPQPSPVAITPLPSQPTSQPTQIPINSPRVTARWPIQGPTTPAPAPAPVPATVPAPGIDSTSSKGSAIPSQSPKGTPQKAHPSSLPPGTPSRKPIIPTREQMSRVSPEKLSRDILRNLGFPSGKRKRGVIEELAGTHNSSEPTQTQTDRKLTATPRSATSPSNPPALTGNSALSEIISPSNTVALKAASPSNPPQTSSEMEVESSSNPRSAPRLPDRNLTPVAQVSDSAPAVVSSPRLRPVEATSSSIPLPQGPPYNEAFESSTRASSPPHVNPPPTPLRNPSPPIVILSSPVLIAPDLSVEETTVLGARPSSPPVIGPAIMPDSVPGPMDVDELIEERDIDQLLSSPAVLSPVAPADGPSHGPTSLQGKSPSPATKSKSPLPGSSRKKPKYYHPTPGLVVFVELPHRPDLVAAAARTKARRTTIATPVPVSVPAQSIVDKDRWLEEILANQDHYHKIIRCGWPRCGVALDNLQRFRKHVLIKHMQPISPRAVDIACDYCKRSTGEVYPNREKLWQHVLASHIGPQRYCPVKDCDMVCKGNEEFWRQHINRGHDTTDPLRMEVVPTEQKRPVYPLPLRLVSISESYNSLVKPARMNVAQRTRITPQVLPGIVWGPDFKPKDKRSECYEMLLEEDVDGHRMLGNPDGAELPSFEEVWRREKDLRAQELGAHPNEPIVIDDEEEEPPSRASSPARKAGRSPLLPINGLETSGSVSDSVLTQKRAPKPPMTLMHSRSSE